ncbi:MAG: hypothetical protein HXS44_08490 [Theionarchaea archaeon]|nr:hypothetical protein [Theionarchaea archaeon]
MHTERVVLEALRHQYVVSFAGFYGEFQGRLLVGIEEKALQKTDLIPYIDRVTIWRLEERTPLFLREHFTVVPINEEDCDIDDSVLQQELGIAVLPEDVLIQGRLEVGERIILNAVLSKKSLMDEKGGNPESWARNLLRNYLVRTKTGLRATHWNKKMNKSKGQKNEYPDL